MKEAIAQEINEAITYNQINIGNIIGAIIGAAIFTLMLIVAIKYFSKLQDIANTNQYDGSTQKIDTSEYGNAYKQKWMFTLNEKETFYKLEKIAKENNLKLFAKVRLYDLIEPRQNHPKYKTHQYKIQAKHVDFVLTTENLIAKYVIELDDNSHNSKERKERDEFVNTVLQNCGYKVLRIKGIQEEKISEFLKS